MKRDERKRWNLLSEEEKIRETIKEHEKRKEEGEFTPVTREQYKQLALQGFLTRRGRLKSAKLEEQSAPKQNFLLAPEIEKELNNSFEGRGGWAEYKTSHGAKYIVYGALPNVKYNINFFYGRPVNAVVERRKGNKIKSETIKFPRGKDPIRTFYNNLFLDMYWPVIEKKPAAVKELSRATGLKISSIREIARKQGFDTGMLGEVIAKERLGPYSDIIQANYPARRESRDIKSWMRLQQKILRRQRQANPNAKPIPLSVIMINSGYYSPHKMKSEYINKRMNQIWPQIMKGNFAELNQLREENHLSASSILSRAYRLGLPFSSKLYSEYYYNDLKFRKSKKRRKIRAKQI